ncbi:MAG: hypothetical protein ACUVTN_08055 [Thermodesulfobacteriota bacterium]
MKRSQSIKWLSPFSLLKQREPGRLEAYKALSPKIKDLYSERSVQFTK